MRQTARNHSTEPRDATAHFQDALARAQHFEQPYDYWLLDRVLPESLIDDLLALPVPTIAQPIFGGRRENNNGMRYHFSPEKQEQFDACRQTVAAFGDPETVRSIERMTKADLSQGKLRVEYCQDVDGFWLEPHLDLGVKLFTMMLYLSKDPALHDAGTDIYDATPAHKLVTSAPYASNKGMIFIPGANTWHGLSKRPIRGVRKSLMINFVSSEWRNESELAYR